MKVICKDCGCIIDTEREDYLEVGGEYVCECCMDDYIICEECGDVVHVDDAYETHDEEWICEYCRNRYYEECACCNELYRRVDLYETRDGDLVCEPCIEWNYCYCEECGNYVHCDDYDSDEECCVWCAEEHEERVIKPYHYHKRFAPIFFDMGENDDNYYIGPEIELRTHESEQATAKALADILGDRAYFEDDCSVQYEMILQPHTYSALVYSNEIREAFEYMKEHCYADRTGLHIHISRTAFGETEEEQSDNIAKLVILHNEGFAFNQLAKLSRREQSQIDQWCRPLSMKSRLTKEELKTRAKTYARYDGGHGVALNCENSKTVEFRLGSGTVDYDEFLNWVDVIRTLVEVCKSIDIDEADNFYKWFEFADERLKKYMESRGVTWAKPISPTVSDCKEIIEKLMDNYNRMLGVEEADEINYNTMLALIGVGVQMRHELGYR